MIITSKKSMNQGVKSMAAKAMSWNQVCKALSGIGGYVSVGDAKVRPIELMQSLGVHVLKNSYTPKDIFAAWSNRMTKDGKVCIMHSVPFMVSVNGIDYRLHKLTEEGKYVGYSMQSLCPLVSAADKADKTDVVVNTTNILKGLQQAVFIDATFAKIAKSEQACAALTAGYVNIGTKKAERWARVAKANNGTWCISLQEKEVASNTQKAVSDSKKSSKRNGKKSA